jgi:hypothetical protein
MKILSLQLTKILAERKSELNNPTVNNNIQFLNVEKDSVELLKEHNILKVNFSYNLTYSNKSNSKEITEKDKCGEIIFEGFFLLSVSTEEQKDFEKAWKKKQVPEEHVEPLFNALLRRCTTKAIPLQDELNLPSPFLQVPSVKVQGPPSK